MATEPRKRKRRTRRKRCALDEALRRRGLDEIGYAETLGGFFDQIDESKTSVSKLKLKLDGLKELGRHLEPKRSELADAAGETPAVVQLVHNVERPLRSGGSDSCEAPRPAEPEETC